MCHGHPPPKKKKVIPPLCKARFFWLQVASRLESSGVDILFYLGPGQAFHIYKWVGYHLDDETNIYVGNVWTSPNVTDNHYRVFNQFSLLVDQKYHPRIIHSHIKLHPLPHDGSMGLLYLPTLTL